MILIMKVNQENDKESIDKKKILVYKNIKWVYD